MPERCLDRRAVAVGATAVLLLAAALRLWALDRLPGGLHFDLAANLFDAVEVGEGARPIYFLRNNGREPLVLYMQAGAGAVLGVTPFSARLVTVGLGLLSVAAIGFAGRQLARLAWPDARARAELVGLAAAGLLAGSYWSVHFSRFGLRTAAVPLFLALAFGLLARGLRRRGPGLAACAGAGACLGLALDSYTGARLAPLALALPLLVGLVAERRPVWLLRLLTLAAAAGAAFAPLGLYYWRHPADFAQHSYDNSVLNPALPGGGTVGAVARGLLTTAAAFVVPDAGSPGGAENLPGRPLLDPLSAAALVVGVGLAIGCLRGPRRPALVGLTLLGWATLMALPSALAIPSPGFVRISGAVPAAALLAALGLVRVAEAVARVWDGRARALSEQGLAPATTRSRGRAPALLVVGGVIAASAAWTGWDYFGVWAGRHAYTAAMQDKADAAAWLAARPAGDRVFLAPLWASDFGVQFLTRGRPVESFAGGLVIPTAAAGESIYAYPYEDATGPEEARAQLPGAPPVETIRDPSGAHPLLRVLRLPPGSVAPPAAPQRLEDGVALAGVETRLAPTIGGSVTVTLRWYATAAPSRDYTVFVQLRDGGGTRAQHDGAPLAGAYPTSRWRPGDLILDRHELGSIAGTVSGTRLYVGMYGQDGRRLRLLDPSGQVSATDEMQLGGF
jgi:hypothetical protein